MICLSFATITDTELYFRQSHEDFSTYRTLSGLHRVVGEVWREFKHFAVKTAYVTIVGAIATDRG